MYFLLGFWIATFGAALLIESLKHGSPFIVNLLRSLIFAVGAWLLAMHFNVA